MGSLLCFRDQGLFHKKFSIYEKKEGKKVIIRDIAVMLKEKQILMYGNNSYGGLPGRDIMALSTGLFEATKLPYLQHRVGQVEYLALLIHAEGVPVIMPPDNYYIQQEVMQCLLMLINSMQEMNGEKRKKNSTMKISLERLPLNTTIKTKKKEKESQI
ncbi:MAG: Tryptophanase [Streblomastix strix]|uniref:Tryptophanase n=1 Tax=Streblomastix strix TaxID=222440 RepID=A0A5J4US57_9EUKA|nr:MAG: Tryptophanase [Streblomastix strix]